MDWHMIEHEDGWRVMQITKGEIGLKVDFRGPGAKEAAEAYIAHRKVKPRKPKQSEAGALE